MKAIPQRARRAAMAATVVRIPSASRSYRRARAGSLETLFNGHTSHMDNIRCIRTDSNRNNHTRDDRAKCADVLDGTPRASLHRRGAILGVLEDLKILPHVRRDAPH